jgi:hypothetical protein
VLSLLIREVPLRTTIEGADELELSREPVASHRG